MIIVWYVWLGLLGLVFGSFANALIWRLHEQEKLEGKASKAAKRRRRRLSITKGRSMCSVCGHELAPKDLVPVFSWLLLRGKCRYCGARIPDSPLVELAMAVLFVASYAWWPLGLSGTGLVQFIFWLGFIVAFVALAAYDLRWYQLPFRIVDKLIWLAAAEVIIVAVMERSWSALWQPLAGAAIIYGLFKGISLVSGGTWIGGGDVRLSIVLGLLAASPLRALLVIFFSSLLGTVVGIPAMLRSKRGVKTRLPYGPCLLAALIIVQLWGAGLVHWYENLLLIG